MHPAGEYAIWEKNGEQRDWALFDMHVVELTETFDSDVAVMRSQIPDPSTQVKFIVNEATNTLRTKSKRVHSKQKTSKHRRVAGRKSSSRNVSYNVDSDDVQEADETTNLMEDIQPDISTSDPNRVTDEQTSEHNMLIQPADTVTSGNKRKHNRDTSRHPGHGDERRSTESPKRKKKSSRRSEQDGGHRKTKARKSDRGGVQSASGDAVDSDAAPEVFENVSFNATIHTIHVRIISHVSVCSSASAGTIPAGR